MAFRDLENPARPEHQLADRSRRSTVSKWVKVSQPNGDRISARIANISQTGCLIECMSVLKVDKPLRIELSGSLDLTASIVWSKSGGGFGCQFDTPLSEFKLRRFVAEAHL